VASRTSRLPADKSLVETRPTIGHWGGSGSQRGSDSPTRIGGHALNVGLASTSSASQTVQIGRVTDTLFKALMADCLLSTSGSSLA
jgi:hypothetical protein